MSELDFDELDKAVNSLMTKPIADDSSTDDTTSTPKPAETVLADSPSQPVDTPADVPAVIATKRRGQFMDVMHPSGDMTKQTAAPTVTRRGVVVQPTGAISVPPAPRPTVVTREAPVSTTPASETVEAAVSTDWPDPIDAMEAHETEQTTTEGATLDEPNIEVPPQSSSPDEEASTVPADVVDEVAASASTEPLTSPFLPDAKVEKRPLGASIPDMPDEAVTPIDTPDAVDLPAELGTAVVELEAEAATIPATPVVAETSVASVDSSSTEQKSDTDDKKDDNATAKSSSEPGSIMPQYSKKPSSDDETHAALYDDVHQNLVEPQKKKSGWIVPVLIVLLIAAGVVGGYVAYQIKLFG